MHDENLLGAFLKDRRTKLDASRFGYSTARRRTPGLRREEVAQRANVSATWYTWLEQGRGGAPSTDVLDRLAVALDLTQVEREHLFLLAQNRPPEVQQHDERSVTPQLQRMLDALEYSPAYVKTAQWDIIAGNRAARVVLRDLMAMPEHERNVMVMMFDARSRENMINWEATARFVVATFRAETARAGFSERARALVDELSLSSPDFRAMWREHDVTTHGAGTKHLQHPAFGPITLEYSAFTVDGNPNLSLVVYNPTTPEDIARVRAFIEQQTFAER